MRFIALFILWFLYRSGLSSIKLIGTLFLPLSAPLPGIFVLHSISFLADSKVARFVEFVALEAGFVLGVP